MAIDGCVPACFLIGQSWRGCFHPPLVRPTSSARTSALNSAPSGRIWASVPSTTYFSACTYTGPRAEFSARLHPLVFWSFCDFLVCCNPGWQWKNTSGSTPVWRGWQRRRWRLRWNKLWMMSDCLTSDGPAPAHCPVSLIDWLHFFTF